MRCRGWEGLFLDRGKLGVEEVGGSLLFGGEGFLFFCRKIVGDLLWGMIVGGGD